MLKKLTIISAILLSSMYAVDLAPNATPVTDSDDADFNFRVMQRVVYVHVFYTNSRKCF